MARLAAGFASMCVLFAVALAASGGAAADGEQTRLRLVTIGRFASPLHLAPARGVRGRLWVVEQAGRIRMLVNGRPVRRPFLDIRARVLSGGEQGLLSVAFHPNYARNRRFFVNYTDTAGDTRVVEYRANRAGTHALPRARRQLLFVNQPYANHNGGQLVFGPDGALYVGMGDGGGAGDPGNRAQSPRSLLGKLVRIDVDRRGAPRRVVALGLRNPWRFSFDRQTSDLYVADVGQGAWEEIDYVPRSRLGALNNFGWDVYEGRDAFEQKQLSQGRLVQPIHVYGRDDGYSVTGGFVYRGRAIPELRGRYLFGDYGSGKIWSLRVERGSARDVRLEAIRVPERASFGEDLSGELYAVSLAGRVYRILAR
ncbi:MAG: PQQ-dependent sugar dehydrogenase [Thermoleophilia bacterium]|nr:PQQ-dependent sugar dehydrogenase [Thermoleophilia bacterium]